MVKTLIVRLRRVLDSSAVLLVLALSLGLNIYLSSRPHTPRSGPTSSVRIGEKMSALTVADLSGHEVRLSWASDKRPTIVYVFTPTCPWCKRNLPNITALSAARQSDYRFIGLSLSTSGLQEYVAANHIAFPVYSYPFANDQKLFSVGGTPATLLVSPDGSVRQLWLGAYSGYTQKKVEEVFRLKLPGTAS